MKVLSIPKYSLFVGKVVTLLSCSTWNIDFHLNLYNTLFFLNWYSILYYYVNYLLTTIAILYLFIVHVLFRNNLHWGWLGMLEFKITCTSYIRISIFFFSFDNVVPFSTCHGVGSDCLCGIDCCSQTYKNSLATPLSISGELISLVRHTQHFWYHAGVSVENWLL